MPQFGGQLAAPVQSLRALVEEIVIAEDLPDFGQVNHVAIVQAVVVNLVLVEERLGEVFVLAPFDTLKFVVAQNHANSLHLAAPDGSGNDGAILVGLHEGRPVTTLDHVAQYFPETVVGCPVENTQIEPLVLKKLLPSDLGAHNDCLFAFFRGFTLFFYFCHWSHLHAFARYEWLYLGVFVPSCARIADIREHIITTFLHFFLILINYLLFKPNSESFNGLTIAHKACHVNWRNVVHVELHYGVVVEKHLNQ